MSAHHTGPHRHLERRITRDARVPLCDDDQEMEHSWRCIPVRPTDDADWFIFDSSRDYKTEWARWVYAEGEA